MTSRTGTLTKTQAVERLVNSFSPIPSRWLEDKISSLPMWGTLFRVTNHVDVGHIEMLIQPMKPDEHDIDQLALFEAAWEDVGETGILALEYDGELLLGIHGAGYDFYEDHWVPLYEAIGYSWHEDP